MLNRNSLALLLAAAVAVSMFSVAAAVPEADTGTPDGTKIYLDAPTPAQQAAQDGSAHGLQTGETAEDPADATVSTPDPEGALSFENIETRMRENSLPYRIMSENAAYIEAIDYEKAMDDLREALNENIDAQWQLQSAGGLLPPTSDQTQDFINQTLIDSSTAATQQTLKQMYDAMREQFDAIKDGTAQKEAADGVRQVGHEQNKLVMQVQDAYILLLEGLAGDAALARGLAAMDRGIQEMELRYQFGQVSALQLQSLKTERSSLASQQLSVQASIKNGLMQLETLVGAEPTGALKLSPLPQVTQEELDAMDLEADLVSAKEASYDLYAAKKTLDDAEEVFEDAGDEYNRSTKNYLYVQAQHTWQAAQYTYELTVQTFELTFRTLYAQVKDCKQVLDASKTALALEEDNYATSQLKYEQGTISKNALLTAEDSLNTARDNAAAAERNLFSAYNDYRWAVDHGILN